MVTGLRALLGAATLAGTVAAAHATPATCPERLLPSSPRTATGSRPLEARDLVELRDFGRADAGGGNDAFSVSPDGRYAALTLRRADPDRDDYCIGVLVVPLAGREGPRLLDTGGELILGTTDLFGVEGVVTGTVRPGTPVWSPDGKWLAYLRRDRGVTQVWRVALDGAPAVKITHSATDILSVAWAARGNTLLVTSRPGLAAANAEIEREGRGGFLYDQRFRLSADTRPHPRAPIPLVREAVDPVSGDLHSLSGDAFAALSGTATPPGADLIARSPGGERAWTTLADDARPFGPTRLRLEVDGQEISCAASLCGDHLSGLWWQRSHELIVVRSGTSSNGGRTAFYRWRIGRDRAPVRLFETIDSLASCRPWKTFAVCARETATKPRTVSRIDLGSGDARPIYDPNPEFDALALGQAQRMTWTDRDGVRSFGDLVLPPHHRPGEKHPLIIVQYLSRGFLRGGTGDDYPIQLFAAHGFAVLSFQKPEPLPAMLAARNEVEAQRINVTGWAERRRIFRSLDAGIDAAIATGAIDPDRIGITGFSDGSSTVSFALNHSDRFKAAATSSCCDEPGVMFTLGQSYASVAAQWGYPPAGHDSRDFWRPQSLALNASRVRVPLLIQASDSEVRGAAESFAALRSRGAPIEMYVFPDENHIKSHPAHRLAAYERGAAWFSFWMREVRGSGPGRAAELGRWVRLRDALH